MSGFNSSLRHTITIYNFQMNIKESQLSCSAIQQIDVVSADMPLAVDSLHREHVPLLDQMDERTGADEDDEFNPAAISLLETEANAGPVKSPIHIAFSPIHWTVFFVVSVACKSLIGCSRRYLLTLIQLMATVSWRSGSGPKRNSILIRALI